MDAPRRKLISIVCPSYNEVENVGPLYAQLQAVTAPLAQYAFEFIFIDNCSTDGTGEVLRKLAAADKRVKVILNARNFGHIRSPVHGLLQTRGDAVICMATDLQDPPALIPQFLAKWEEGYKIALGVKTESRESFIFWCLRGLYYGVLRRLSSVEQIQHATGFGLYDRQIIDVYRTLDDPYPYFRGILADIGFPIARIPYAQPRRTRGLTKNNFYTLYDLAMLGMTSYTKVPLRLAAMVGFICAIGSLFVALAYLVYKLLFWKQFELGLAPLVVGAFFLGSVQLFFLGIVGEYIGAIHTLVQKRPLVVEKERINFDVPPEPGRTQGPAA